MKVAIASDHSGVNIRKGVISLMEELNIEYIDLGCECSSSVDYPDYAIPVANKVERGVLICGTALE
ncbi:UNVERIFIED_ORG: RpiB/LacA/LacB family sugar-phosphate isomerase [Peribacillus simplex]